MHNNFCYGMNKTRFISGTVNLFIKIGMEQGLEIWRSGKKSAVLGMRDTILENVNGVLYASWRKFLRGKTLKQVIFAGCDLSASDFRRVKFVQVQFIQCNLSDVDFADAELEEVEFTDSQMQNACFSRTALASHALSAQHSCSK